MSPGRVARRVAGWMGQTFSTTLGVVILGSYVLAIMALVLGGVGLSRQTSVATDRANAAIATAIASGRDAQEASCDFISAFITFPGETPYVTAKGRTQEIKARAAYLKNGCPRVAGPLPPVSTPTPRPSPTP